MRFSIFLSLIVAIGWIGQGRIGSGQDVFRAFFHSVARDTQRNHAWPGPFEAQPRIATRAPFNIMVANGWRYQNMLGDHHFDSETHELTLAGEAKITEIIYRNPPQHRAIYVRRGATPDETNVRMHSVHGLALSIAPDGQIPPIYETFDEPPLNDASRINAVQQLSGQSMIAPVLPAPKSER